jgi:hypothetical protein
VEATSTGSTLVDPSTVSGNVSHSVIHGSRKGNYLPGDRKA